MNLLGATLRLRGSGTSVAVSVVALRSSRILLILPPPRVKRKVNSMRTIFAHCAANFGNAPLWNLNNDALQPISVLR